MHAKMTILGIERFLNNMTEPKSLADQFKLPSVEEYDADLLLATIIRNYQSLPTLYEDPEYFYEECDFWWRIHKNNYAKMFETIGLEYNPIDNYNKISEISVDTTGNKQKTDTTVSNSDGSNTNTGTGTITDDTTVSGKNNSTSSVSSTVGVTGSTSAETKVSAYNETKYQPSNKVDENSNNTTTTKSTDTTKGDNSSNVKSTETRNTKDTNTSSLTTNSNYNGLETDDINTITKENTHGNIGVTRTQEMITEELSLRLISVYNLIAQQFADEMLLSIW